MTTLKRLRVTAIRLAELQHLALHANLKVPADQLDALNVALTRIEADALADKAITLHIWEPKPEQIWRPYTYTSDGKRMTAWRFYQADFAPMPYEERPTVWALRHDERTLPFASRLEDHLWRNKAQHLPGPTAMSQLFPARAQAMNGRTPWTPTPEQIWTPGMLRTDGKRLSARRFFERTFALMKYEERPFCHELRQNEATRSLYDSLCVWVSRNARHNRNPSSIEELFPMAVEAAGGHLRRRQAPTESPAPGK